MKFLSPSVRKTVILFTLVISAISDLMGQPKAALGFVIIAFFGVIGLEVRKQD